VLDKHEFRRELRYSAQRIVSKMPLQERVRQRFKALVDEKGVSHEIIGNHLGLSRSAVTRLLNDEGSGFALPHIEKLCEFFQVTPSEIMAEPFSLIQAISPIEASILDIVRKMNELSRHSLLTVLEWPMRSSATVKRAGRTPDHLSPEDAMVLSLYRGMEDADAQSGIVMQMRGYVQAKQTDRSEKKRAGK
jgi:DNA-binding Xre family transcriptional regulator